MHNTCGPGVLAKDNFGLRMPDGICWIRLECVWMFDQGSAMNAGFVPEYVPPGYRLVMGNNVSGGLSHERTEFSQSVSGDPMLDSERALCGHYDLLKCGVACALSQSINSYADAISTPLYSGNGIGGRHTEIVVAVEFQSRADYRLSQLGKNFVRPQRIPYADGVRNANAIGTVHLGKGGKVDDKVCVCTRCILRPDGDVGESASAVLDQFGKVVNQPITIFPD